MARNRSALLVDSDDFFDILGMLVKPSSVVFQLDYININIFESILKQSNNMKRES